MAMRRGLLLGFLILAVLATTHAGAPADEALRQAVIDADRSPGGDERLITALDAWADSLARRTLRLDELVTRERIAELRRTGPASHTLDAVAALRDLASLYSRLGPLERAEEVLREAIELRESIAERGAPEVEALLRELERALEQLRPDDPEREAILVRLSASDPRTEDLHRLGRVLAERAENERAIETFERALDREQNSSAGESRWPWLLLSELGRAHERSGRPDQAEEAYRRAIDVAERALGSRHPQLVQPLSRLGAFYVEAGRYEDALSPLERASELGRLAWGETESACACACGSSVRELLETTYRALGREERLRRLPPEPPAKTASESAADADAEGVFDLRSRGRIREALEQAELAIGLARGRNGDSPDVAERLGIAASILLYQGRGAEALERAREALRILESDSETPRVRLADLYLLAGNAAASVAPRDGESDDFLRRELDVRLELGHRQRAAILLQQLGTRAAPADRGAEALEALERALALWCEMSDPSAPEAVTIRTEIALTHLAQQRWDEAERWIAELLPIALRQNEYRHQRIVEAAERLREKTGREVLKPGEGP